MKLMNDELLFDLPGKDELTAESGLTSQQAEELLRTTGGNAVNERDELSVGKIFRTNICTFLNLINIVLAILLFVVGSYRNMLFMGAVACNTVIGIVQQFRARSALKRLQLMNRSTVNVRRDGKDTSIPSDDIVCGDIIKLSTGDQIPADCMVLNGHASANESLLTGESDDCEKKPGARVYAGSYITSGSITVQAVRVGANSYANQLTARARVLEKPKSYLMAEMSKLIRFITIIMIPLGVLLFVRQISINHKSVAQAMPSAVGAMVGMIPNGLAILVSAALVVGVIKLSQKKVLVRELYGIEALACADVICLDKTGTLTSGKMTVQECIPAKDIEETQLRLMVGRFLGSIGERNMTTEAIAASVSPVAETAVNIIPFSSKRKYSAVTLKNNETLILGAKGFVPCEIPQYALETFDRETSKGNRVLVFAQSFEPNSDDEIRTANYVGLIILSDELRVGAEETLRMFTENGVSIRVISGDDPIAVSAIASKLRIPNAEKALDVSTIEDARKLATLVPEYTVFGRVSPERKRIIVEALKAAGKRVAMTGDGVNDIPAMKASDCSIVMAAGSDAARHAAMVTLLDSDFDSIPSIVSEGRRVVNNITRGAVLFIVKTLYSLGLSLLVTFLPVDYPFQPIQLTLIASLTIGLPSFLLALEPNNEKIEMNFLSTVLKQALPGSICVVLSACIAMFLDKKGFSTDQCSTIAAICAAVTGIVMLVRVSIPFTRYRACIVSLCALLMCAAIGIIGKLFLIDLSMITGKALLAAAIGALICIVANFAIAAIIRPIRLTIGRANR